MDVITIRELSRLPWMIELAQSTIEEFIGGMSLLFTYVEAMETPRENLWTTARGRCCGRPFTSCGQISQSVRAWSEGDDNDNSWNGYFNERNHSAEKYPNWTENQIRPDTRSIFTIPDMRKRSVSSCPSWQQITWSK
jgi:hypothetical protein